MTTTSSFMSTLAALALVVGSLLRIALNVAILSSLCIHIMHSHKLKVRSGLWRLLRSSNLYSCFSAVVLFRRGGNCERHCLGLTREDLMVGVHQFNHPVSTMGCPHVKPAEVYSRSGCD